MDLQLLGMISAAMGVMGTIIFFTLAVLGIKTLREVRAELRTRPER